MKEEAERDLAEGEAAILAEGPLRRCLQCWLR